MKLPTQEPDRCPGTSAALVVSAIIALLAIVPVAHAGYDPLGSGVTKLSLDHGFLALLRHNGVKLSAVAPAKLKGSTASFPISGGEFDPTVAKGTVEHEGALVFEAGNRTIPLRSPQVKTTSKRSPLSAKVGGSQLKLATAAGLVVSRQGFGDRVRVSSLALSAKLATRLAKKLRLRGVFKAGDPLGRALATAQPETVTVLGKGKAELTLNPEIVAKLNRLFVAVNPIFPAEHIGSTFTLPIFGGHLAPDVSQGTLETSGALEFLQLGGGQVFWHEPGLDFSAKVQNAEVDVEPSPPYAGKVGRTSIADLSLIGAVPSSNPRARTIAAAVPLVLGAQSAANFNQAFAEGKPAFVAGEPLGSIFFTAQGQ